jgi:multiple sugar transport system substrate-binding protein
VPKTNETVLTFSGSALGAEGTLVAKQLKRFMQLNPGIRVELQRTPDDANQRHQLYVQWLNARVGNPSVLQLDVIWTPEFAAAGWVLPLDKYGPVKSDFFPATIAANTWAGKLYALPWFADVGLLYRRTDLVPREPQSLEELVADAQSGMAHGGPRYGFVSQAARYEGLITGFVEYLGAFGGRIIDDSGEVVVNRPEAVRALEFMRDELYKWKVAPLDVLTWHEEEARFAFQNGNAVFMRNWPYAVGAMSDTSQSKVIGKFAVTPMPKSATAPNGHSTAALGGAQLAINAYTDHPDAAYKLIAYLTAPEQMLERAQAVGQYPTRPGLYDDARLRGAINIPLENARRAIESATPRPVTPIYTELSEILQIQLHRALVRQVEPRQALDEAAARINALIERTGMRKLMRGTT